MRDKTDLNDARQILTKGSEYLDTLVDQRVWKFGRLTFFDQDELRKTKDIENLISDYISDSFRNKPLCVAVFGPPGSGKSFAVREILLALQDLYRDTHAFPYSEINLTQIQSQADLTEEMRAVYLTALEEGANSHINVIDTQPKTPIPFVFFDEFDAPNDGVPLGWLKWFLAPMQDGVIGHGTHKFSLSRAIYFFAGGTSSAMSEFTRNTSDGFKNSKGPDFVSRLRGYLDISGPNSEKSVCSRRAIIIRHAITDKNGNLNASLEKKVQDNFFYEGRFKHGARSINSLIEMSKSNALRAGSRDKEGKALIKLEHFPPPHIRGIHADQGPLSKDGIKGLIGLSVGSDTQEEANSPASSCITALISQLWMYGATAAFGGQWTGLTMKFVEQGRLGEVITSTPSRIEIFARHDKPQVKSGKGVTIVPVPTHWVPHPDARLPEQARACIAAYRMRWMMSCRCVARIIIGGKLHGFSGRMPGVFEEAAMALALRQPLYILGGFGGASRVCGELLGLSIGLSSTKRDAGFLKEEAEHRAFIKDMKDELTPTTMLRFPLLASEAVSFISQHAFGGPLWPDNGLTLEENRELFLCTNQETAVSLVLRGLLRRFA